jgi:hypothetical protein
VDWPFEELTRGSLLNRIAQPQKLIYSLICLHLVLAFKIVHRRGADRTPHCLALIKHREINDHPIEVVAQYFASLQRHCKSSVLKRSDYAIPAGLARCARGHRVADAQCGELFAAAIEKWIVVDNERACSHLGQGREKRYRSLIRCHAEHDVGLPQRALQHSLRKDDYPSSSAKSQAYPLALLVIRRGFGCVALSFAQRNLLVLLSLFFLAPCACCPLSFSPVSTVIWLECHWILLCGGLILYLVTLYMHVFEFCLSLYLPA